MEDTNGETYHEDNWCNDIPIQQGVVKMLCKGGELKSKNLNSFGKLVNNVYSLIASKSWNL